MKIVGVVVAASGMALPAPAQPGGRDVLTLNVDPRETPRSVALAPTQRLETKGFNETGKAASDAAAARGRPDRIAATANRAGDCPFNNAKTNPAPLILDLGVSAGATGARADGVSADGSTVVGFEGSLSIGAFRWTEMSGNVNLGTPSGSARAYATDVNANGSVVVGYGTSASRGFRWTQAGGMQPLLPLLDDRFSRAYAVSSDGAIVAGESYGSTYSRAVWWGADGTGHDLGANPSNSVAYGASEDGLVIVGYSDPNGFYWKSGHGIQLLSPIVGWTRAIAMAVSGNGMQVCGSLTGANPVDAPGFIWTATDGMRLLPPVRRGQPMDDSVTCISKNGVLVGGASRLAGGQYQAAIWHPAVGGWMLKEYLLQQGVSAEDWVFNSVYGINSDGTVLVGSGTHNGVPRAWMITGFMPVQACPADLNHDSVVDDDDFVFFVNDYNILDCADPSMILWCPSDLTHDALVDDADFTVFAGAYNDLLCP